MEKFACVRYLTSKPMVSPAGQITLNSYAICECECDMNVICDAYPRVLV